MKLHGRILGLALLVGQALAWNHISDVKLKEALDSSGYTLVACKLMALGCCDRGPVLLLTSDLSWNPVVLVRSLDSPWFSGTADMPMPLSLSRLSKQRPVKCHCPTGHLY